MTALPLLFFIIFGYVYCKWNTLQKYNIHKQKPQQYIYNLIHVGFYIWVSSVFAVYSYDTSICNIGIESFRLFIQEYFVDNSKKDPYYLITVTDINIFIVGLFFSVIFAIVGNIKLMLLNFRYLERFKKLESINVRALSGINIEFNRYCIHILYRNDLIKSMIIKHVGNYNKTILFDMSNKKVYIGYVSDFGYPDENDSPNQCKIIPIISGYRNEQGVIIYNEQYDQSMPFDLIMREQDIVSIREIELPNEDNSTTKQNTTA